MMPATPDSLDHTVGDRRRRRTPSDPAATPPPSRHVPRVARTRALTVGGAVFAALAVWAIAGPMAGIDLRVAPDGQPPHSVGPAMVALSSLTAGLAAWGLLAALERVTARATHVWTVIALIVLAASMLGPPAADSTAALVSLATMHLVVAAVLIPALPRTAVTSRPTRR